MIELEKLYVCAEKYLAGEKQDWAGFAINFRLIFKAEFVFYRPTYEAGILAWRSMDGLVVTTNPEVVEKYIKDRIFDLNQIPDNSLNPLEPSRRSDVISNETYRTIDVVKKYFIPNGIFYMLAVLAIERDDNRLMLVVWRDESESDFSDIEKQRIALFMRYLSVLADSTNTKNTPVAKSEIKDFGKRYGLTFSETEVLTGLLQGKSLRQIAIQSKRSYGTVRWHVRNILEKCQVKSQRNLLSEFYALIKR